MLQKQQKQQANEYVITNSLTTGVHDQPVGRVTTSSRNSHFDTKPADNKGNIKSSEDAEYDVIQSSQSNIDNIEMYENPSYAEPKFT